MSRTVLLTKTKVSQHNQKAATEHFGRTRDRLKLAHPKAEATLWTRARFEDQFLSLLDFPSDEDSDAALKDLMDSGMMEEGMKFLDSTPDQSRFHIHGHKGLQAHETEIQSWLSLSQRVSQPGRGRGLEDELDFIFEELQVIDGFTGSMQGRNPSLREETCGIVFWSKEDAFLKSIPERTIYEVVLYRRVL